MLTLKSPIQLQSSKPILTFSDGLGHKIIGNYQLMHLSITAQDLLHMTVQEPEIYLSTSQNQITVINHHETLQNEEKLEAMNQFFNRIMLLHTSDFTYQDEVFVTTILQKLGIMDVSSFILQIQETMDANYLLQKLVTKYFEQGNQIENDLSLFLDQHKDIIKGNTIIDQPVTNQLQNMVFKHLYTAETINTVYDYQKRPFETNCITKEQAKLLTQLKQADVIHLTGLRHYILLQNAPVTYIQQNQYEQKLLTKEDITQEKVMQNLAAVILSNLAQNMTYEVETNMKSMMNWMDYTQVFYDTTLDAIQRFEENQIEDHSSQLDIHEYINYRKQLYKDEVTLLEILEQLQQDDMVYQDLSEKMTLKQNTILALLENQNLQQQLEESLNYYTSQIHNESKLENEQQNLEVLQILQEQADSYKKLQEYYLVQDSQFVENRQQDDITEISSKVNKQYVEHSNVQDYNSENLQNFIEQEINNQELKKEETTFSTQNQEEYIAYIQEINQKNIEMQKLLSSQNTLVDHTKKIIIDKKLAKEKALKALENPQEVLQEIYQNSVSIETPVAGSVEKYLRFTDDRTRKLYEKILGINTKENQKEHIQVMETNSETVQQAVTELISESENTIIQKHRTDKETYESMQNITDILQQVIENQKQINLQETVSVKELLPVEEILGSDILKENVSLIQAPLQRLEQQISTKTTIEELPKQEETVKLIHQRKEQIKEEMIDDVLNKLTINTNATTQELFTEQTEQTISRQMQQTKKEIISENEEMIEKLLHNRMQTQLRVISDQVYQDIERRLQSERRRRGY